MKHLIFIGKPQSGKSLFASILFDRRNTLFIAGADVNFNDHFIFDYGRSPWNYENVIVDDPHKKNFSIESLMNLCCSNEMIINKRFKEPEVVKTPRFILILDSDIFNVENLPQDGSFLRRFKILDFDKNKISDLTKLISDEKIIINTDR